MLTRSRSRALLEQRSTTLPLVNHLIPWDDPTLRDAISHHRRYHSSPLSTHHILEGNKDRSNYGIIPTINSIQATLTLTLDSLYATALPPLQPPPNQSDNDINPGFLVPTPDYSDSSSSSSFCGCGNCEQCCNYWEHYHILCST